MYFRADKRDFEVGDVITTAGEFQTLNPPDSIYVENVFESVRPTEKPQRLGNLYLFRNEIVAKKHWSKMTGGNLYTARVDDFSLHHEGDMRLVNMAYENRLDTSKVESLAKDYWSGIFTTNPMIEVIVRCAVITNIVSKDQKERVTYFKSWALA